MLACSQLLRAEDCATFCQKRHQSRFEFLIAGSGWEMVLMVECH
jgi:hypothetical protein